MVENPNLMTLGKAFLAVARKDTGEQDARGWNKYNTAVWKEYMRLIDAEHVNI